MELGKTKLLKAMYEQSELPKLAFLELQDPEYLERLREAAIIKVGKAASFCDWVTGEMITWRREEATARPHKLGLDTFRPADKGGQLHTLHQWREDHRALQHENQQTVEDISNILSDWGFEEPVDWPIKLTDKRVQITDPWGGDAA